MKKIKSTLKVYTTSPETNWEAGEVKEIDEKTAEILLKNNNFKEVKQEYLTRELKGRNNKIIKL
jgi:hypothetical protein